MPKRKTSCIILTAAVVVGVIGGDIATKYIHSDGTIAALKAAGVTQYQTQSKASAAAGKQNSGYTGTGTSALPSTQPTPTPTQPDTSTAPNLVPSCRIVNFGSQLPQFSIYLENDSDSSVVVNSVTIAGYDVGAETGSTTVNIGQVITPDQSQTYSADLPGNWYTDITGTDGNQDTYQAIPETCQILWYS